MSDSRRHDEAGLSPRVLWTAAGVIWLVLGLVQVASYAFKLTPKPLPLYIMPITGVLPLILSATWFVCARKEVSDRWFHLPLVLGLVVIGTGAALDPNDHSADVVYPMLPMIVALVIFPLSRAWYYVIGAMIGSCAMVIFGHGPTPGLRVVVTAEMVIALAGLLATGQLQLRRALARNRELSEIDGLTGVANVRRLTARLEDELERNRGVADFALLALDLDDFKAVNDTLGHSTGDRVLIEVARAIEKQVEPVDLVARRGGDEFTIVALPHDGRSVEQLRDRIAAAIVETRTDLCPTIEPRASIGYVRHRPGESAEQLFDRADAALHDQKIASHERRGGARSQKYTVVEDDRSVRGAKLLPHRAEQEARPWAEIYADASWRMIAGVFAVIAATIPLLGLANSQSNLLSAPIFATCLVSAVFAALCMFMVRRGNTAIRIAVLGVAFLLSVILIAQAADARNAVIDLLVLPAVLAFYVAGRRGGFVYAVLSMGLYLYFLLAIKYDLAVLRAAQTSVVVLLMGQLVPKVTAQARATALENERLSGVDPLTGLANVRRMNQRLADDLARVQAIGGYVTVFMIDLDDFKQVNDVYNHGRGDDMLIAVGEAITRHMRSFDLVVRRGGDEFVAIVSHDGDLDLASLASRVEQEIFSRRVTICPDLNPQPSIGWVTSRPGDTPAELLARADASEKTVKQRHRATPDLSQVDRTSGFRRIA